MYKAELIFLPWCSAGALEQKSDQGQRTAAGLILQQYLS